jgi:dTDP-4-dehydrorhamnose 3,5-epimerase-like enzyme
MIKAQRISFPEIVDPRGRLMFAEEGPHIPFPVKRLFAIYDVPKGVARGGHAHRVQQQLLMMYGGECEIVVDDGHERSIERLSRPTEGLYVPAGLWIELRGFTSGAVCVVLSSDVYDETDYIRDYDAFQVLARS